MNNCSLLDGRRGLLLTTAKIGVLMSYEVQLSTGVEWHFSVKRDPISKYSDEDFNKLVHHKHTDNLEVEWVDA